MVLLSSCTGETRKSFLNIPELRQPPEKARHAGSPAPLARALRSKSEDRLNCPVLAQEAQTMAQFDAEDVPQSVSVGEGSRALVAQVTVAGEHTDRGKMLARAAAPFVAQLIATASNSPQTRVLRRAAPRDAATAYGRGPKLDAEPAPHGAQLSRLF
jgi:hypothetical protein